MLRYLLMASLSASACNKSNETKKDVDRAATTEATTTEAVKPSSQNRAPTDFYDQYRQKSVHNAYERKESLPDQIGSLGLRSVELDIHSKRKGSTAKAGDWFVYHDDENTTTSVNRLSEGLAIVKKEADNARGVITLWLDLKEDFKEAEGYGPEHLDAILRAQLGSALYAPSDFLKNCGPNAEFKNAEVECKWPTLSSLKGRVIVVLTGSPVKIYAKDALEAAARLGFIAPEIGKEEDLQKFAHAVFFNLARETVFNTQLPEILHRKHCISRTWDINSEGDWKKVMAKPVHHIATDKVNTGKDPWAVVGEGSSPFQQIDKG